MMNNPRKSGSTKLYTLFLFLFVAQLTAVAQPKTFSLKGAAKVNDGDIYPYQLSLSLNGNVITGQSITKQPDGRELKAKIKGEINRKKHTLHFTEVESVPPTPVGGENTCLFDVRLAYKLHNGHFLVSGLFKGKDDAGAACGEGVMVFDQPDGPTSIFHEDGKTPEKKKDSTAAPITLDKNDITEGVDKQIEWHSDKCLLEVWDGGVEDGDVIIVKLNGKEVLTDHALVKEKKQLQLILTEHINTITIVAGDEGTAPPNTAQVAVTDGNDHYQLTAFNKKGKTANIVIIRK